jgi:uncharacterized protein (TIGR02246 family)
MRKAAIAATAGIVCTAVVTIFAAQSDTDVLREMKDRAQIEDLMWRYTRALDTNDADAYASTYTVDGQFSAGTTATKGRDALRKMIADLRTRAADAQAKGERRPPLYHMTANERITFSDKDHARVEAYYLTASPAAGEKTPLRVIAVGRSVDDLVRVDGAWLIKTRNVAPQD